ncbi:MAG: DHH family phosphoesterase, partial [Eubacteriales bacterium]|nr:DHH family phosphoesterase [Eubacteriales bacterium]
MAKTNKEEQNITEQAPLPMVVVDQKGKIVERNEAMKQVFIFDEIKDYDFFALSGIRLEELKDAAENKKSRVIERNDRVFRLFVRRESSSENSNLYVYFLDITGYETLKVQYENEKICVARINIDNYDEMKANTSPETQITVRGKVDKQIRAWASGIKGSLVSVSDSAYIVYFEKRYADEIIRSKFSILDEVRKIESGADFPMSLSIGIGIDGKSIQETREFADAALDLALGRGGDQAVVSQGSKIDYYGGKSQSVEKGNKGKSRVIAHALERLLKQSDRVMIMGHRNPDMDAFGSALGMVRVCQMMGYNANIVLDEVNDTLTEIYRNAQEQGNYSILKKKRALEMITPDTLLIIVDTHRPSYVECPELLEKTDKIAVIDHHRKAADAIKNPLLSYIESYASSASELVT